MRCPRRARRCTSVRQSGDGRTRGCLFPQQHNAHKRGQDEGATVLCSRLVRGHMFVCRLREVGTEKRKTGNGAKHKERAATATNNALQETGDQA